MRVENFLLGFEQARRQIRIYILVQRLQLRVTPLGFRVILDALSSTWAIFDGIKLYAASPASYLFSKPYLIFDFGLGVRKTGVKIHQRGFNNFSPHLPLSNCPLISY